VPFEKELHLVGFLDGQEAAADSEQEESRRVEDPAVSETTAGLPQEQSLLVARYQATAARGQGDAG